MDWKCAFHHLLHIYTVFFLPGIVCIASMNFLIHFHLFKNIFKKILIIFRKPVDSTRLLECYKSGKVCHCEQCSGVIKPDILFYNEKVSDSILSSFQKEAESADLLLILGTSLSTYPVSDCLSYFQNCDIVWDLYRWKLMV